MANGIYNRETQFQKNIVDGIKEVDMGSISFPDLVDTDDYKWTIVRDQEKCRPDLLSFRIYGSDNLWWVLMWLNGIQDPWHDLMDGVAIKYVPLDLINNAFKYNLMK